jgi:HTH-type transcriptional repressor of NAD biosynthesis genes
LGDRGDQTIPAGDRARWLEDVVPGNVSIVVTPDDLPTANEPWAQRALEVLPERPTVAFTSESWGPGWAEAMGCRHVAVDIDRREFPISANAIRADLKANFGWMVPASRAELARRVVVVGTESTGKTTLAEALAETYGTVWVPEYGRSYWEGRRHLVDHSWDTDEFTRIATTHHEVEAHLARRAVGGLVVSDTDALVTGVWHRRYLGFDSPVLADIAARHRPDLYLVCAPDFDWAQDGTRESLEHCADMHRHTLASVEKSGVGFEVLTGDHDFRLRRASEHVDELTIFPTLI